MYLHYINACMYIHISLNTMDKIINKKEICVYVYMCIYVLYSLDHRWL